MGKACAHRARLSVQKSSHLIVRSDRAATLEEAKAQFQKSWDEWKAWAKMEEAP
jgi:hypothetical protein